MELLIFMVFMVAGFLFFDMLSTNPSRNPNEVVKKCHEIDQTHDWTTHPVTNKLTCTKCNFEAYSE